MSKTIRPLHLHTLDTLCTDLVSGRSVGIGEENKPFSLASKEARSVLNWYVRNRPKWAARLAATDVEAIIANISEVPKPVDEAEVAAGSAIKRYSLVKLEAHAFAGLHVAATEKLSPFNFIHNFTALITMFEGMNGCGKTSLLNAIIWALTGEILRPQRQPEPGTTEFEFEVAGPDARDAPSTHQLTPVTPLPNLNISKPAKGAVQAHTWVQLTFKEDSGAVVVIRREQSRNSRGKLQESESGFTDLGIDPIALRTGTVMPGMLPFIQIGESSTLGQAVAELTGMAPLVDLASHAERSKKKIDGDFTRDRKKESVERGENYLLLAGDMSELFKQNPPIKYPSPLPISLHEKSIDNFLDKLQEHFEQIKATALSDAKQVLGETFNADDANSRSDLERNIGPAIIAARNVRDLTSAARLASLAKLDDKEIANARALIKKILADAQALADLAADPSKAARIRLYSLLADWIKEHPNVTVNEAVCLVCGKALEDAVDPTTGKTIKAHIHDATSEDARLLSLTLSRWASQTQASLASDLPDTLSQEIRKDLPSHPGKLIEKALCEELFQSDPFEGVLGALSSGVAKKCADAVAALPPLIASNLPASLLVLSEFDTLRKTVQRLDLALRFAAWRKLNLIEVATMFRNILGQVATEGQATVPTSLLGYLLRLQAIVQGVDPVNRAITLCTRMKADRTKLIGIESQLEAYAKTSAALGECTQLGELVNTQIQGLQSQLHSRAVVWRNHIYQGAFPSTNLEFVESRMQVGGHLDLYLGAAGLSAPAQHVSNASALRASLVSFFLAYWEHLLTERGGLRLLILDDPQELLDGDNKERLAEATANLVKANAQLIMTSHDSRFAAMVSRCAKSSQTSFDFQYVHPATPQRGTLWLSPNVHKIHQLHADYASDRDSPDKAQSYALQCRIFIEARLGDLFDDAAFPAATVATFAPTLSDHLARLRGMVSSGANELHKSPVLRKFCVNPALQQGSDTLALLNKAHHGEAHTIRPIDVKNCEGALERLRRDVESLHEEFRLFRRRAPLQRLPLPVVNQLATTPVSKFEVDIQPSLVAFVSGAAVGESQESALEKITSAWFHDKAFFLLRSNNFGFAGQATSIAIVETISTKAGDRDLVIARHGEKIYARRLLRSENADFVTLAAETPDPRISPPSLLLPESELSLHRVVGMLFGGVKNPPRSTDEAVNVDCSEILAKIRSAYRIKEDSAIPLALEGQIALGGPIIELDKFDEYRDEYVALHLTNGTSIFKRVGEKLPRPLDHLRRFETIGGWGLSELVASGKDQYKIPSIHQATLVIGVLYTAL